MDTPGDPTTPQPREVDISSDGKAKGVPIPVRGDDQQANGWNADPSTASPSGALVARRYLSLGELFGDTFRVYRRGFRQLLVAAATVHIPLVACIGGLFGLAQIAPMVPAIAPVLAAGKSIVSLPLFMLTSWVNYCVLVKVGADLVVGKPANPRSALTVCRDRLGPIASSIFVRGIAQFAILFIGLMLFILPGVIGFVWAVIAWCLVEEIAIFEGMGGWAACRRSKELVNRSRGTAGAFMFLVFGLVIGVNVVLTVAAQGLVAALSSVVNLAMLDFVLAQGIQIAGALVLAPISALAMVHLYFALREHYEGLPPAALMKQLESKK